MNDTDMTVLSDTRHGNVFEVYRQHVVDAFDGDPDPALAMSLCPAWVVHGHRPHAGEAELRACFHELDTHRNRSLEIQNFKLG